MNETVTTTETRARNPILAVLLSVAATGLGHIYCGRMLKGLILFFAGFVFAPIIVVAAQNAASTVTLALVIASVMVMLGIFVYALVDAGLLARRRCAGYTLKEYNRWYIYLIFIVVSVSYPANLSYSIRDHLLQAFKIPSQHMAPSILSGDRIFLNKAVYKIRSIQRGDVVIFPHPDDRRLYFMKRIVALPGESVAIRDNVLYINDQPLAYEPAALDPDLNFSPEAGTRIVTEVNGSRRYPVIINVANPDNVPKIVVPHGQCYVLSDNRLMGIPNDRPAVGPIPRSGDSRHLGPIPLADIKGRLDYIYWPVQSWKRFGKFGH
jgi:signal peptidase I